MCVKVGSKGTSIYTQLELPGEDEAKSLGLIMLSFPALASQDHRQGLLPSVRVSNLPPAAVVSVVAAEGKGAQFPSRDSCAGTGWGTGARGGMRA